MELHKLSVGDFKGLDAGGLRNMEKDIRKELLKIRMDIYTAKSAQGAKVHGLRKSLARLLTIKNQAKAGAKPAAKNANQKTKTSK